MKKKKRKISKKARIIRDVFLFIIPIVLFLSIYYGYEYYIAKQGIPSVNKLIEDKKKNNFQDKEENKIEIEKYVNQMPDYRNQYGNPDIMGKLEIPNLNIDTLVTRANDNQYYLNYSIYRQWDELGVPFFDFRNIDLNTSRQINIYGHNTERRDLYDKLPLTNLEAYVDKSIFDNYKDVYLSIDERQIHYEVVAIKILTDNNPEHTKVVFKDDNEFLQHIDIMLKNSLYISENAKFTAKDRLLVMQICHYNPRNSYLLVICKEV